MSQRIMNRNRWKRLHIDERSQEDLERRIEELAESYATGWHPDPDRPDIGVALQKIFAGQMKENIDRANDVLDRYHTEFVNMLDISLLPAKPASGIVVAEMASDTVPGTSVPRRSRFSTSSGDPIVFETEHGIYVTSAQIRAAFFTDGENGAISPLMGHFVKPEIWKDVVFDPVVYQEDGLPGVFHQESLQPFTLFGRSGYLDQCLLVFYHGTVFDAEKKDIFMRIEGGEDLIQGILSGQFSFYHIAAEDQGICPIRDVELMDDQITFRIRKEEPGRVIEEGGKEYQVLLLASATPVQENIEVSRISFASSGGPEAPLNVNNGTNDLEPSSFDPFGDTLMLYNECYVCHDKYFSKAGAKMRITFDLSFDEHRITLTPEEVDKELKIIKLRPRTGLNENPASCFAEEVAIEYFNGTGWRMLPGQVSQRTMFSKGQAQTVEMEFLCPEDWEPVSAGAYDGRCIRLQILKSDNCYIRPAIHTYPHIRNMQISFSYEETYTEAPKAEALIGTRRFDLTAPREADRPLITFRRGEYEEDALYLGFSARLEGGPVSLLFQLEDGMRYEELPCRFEYGTRDGFRPVKVLDYTQDFTRSGVIMFMPPADMARRTIEGQSLFWIRILRASRRPEKEDPRSLPKVCDIKLNAIQVSNIDTRPTKDLYIEEVEPNMRFALGVTNVLDADVWVNELGRLSRENMNDMLAAGDGNCYAEYDVTRQISAFYVRWKEVSHLDTSEDPRCYVLDRLQNVLIFGDGVHTWIPRVTEDVALRVTVRCCDGQRGNVDVGEISIVPTDLVYVGAVKNPVRAYGGSNIEDLDNALERGASILSSRNRFVSMKDYEQAILSYSDTIDQVKGIVGVTQNGKADESEISFVLLMKDFQDGSFAFHRIAGGLKRYLLEGCELTVVPEKLHLVEPVYVEISVAVWVNIVDMNDSFEVQTMMQECLESYLDPLGFSQGSGWKIGTLPKKSQLLMRMNVLKSKAIVKKSVMTARYTDADGTHEQDLEDVEVSPFMLCRSGEYKVHILY